MRTNTKTILVMFVAIVAVGCGPKKSVNVTPTAPPETVEQMIERLRRDYPETAKKLEAEQEAVRKVAAELKHQKETEDARKAIKKSYTPAERKALDDIKDREKRVAKYNRDSQEVRALAAVTGCAPGAPPIIVKSRAVGKGSYWPHIRVTVTNSEKVPVTISDAVGPVVTDLGPGCTVHLYRAMSGWEDQYQVVQFHYTAEARFPDGSLGIAESPVYTLQMSDIQFQREKQGDWAIELRRR